MSIECEKKFTISGNDVELLSTALELARRYIDKHNNGNKSGACYVDEYDFKQINEVVLFQHAIWDA